MAAFLQVTLFNLSISSRVMGVDGRVYEVKAVDSSLGSVFSNDSVTSDGSILAAIPFDTLWAVVAFHTVYKNLYELGLGDEHPEHSSMLKDWAHLRTISGDLDFIANFESVSNFFDQLEIEKIVSLLEERYLSPERTQSLAGHKLFKTVTNEKLFAQRWGLENAGSSQFAKAFALEILSEYIPACFLDPLVKRAEFTFQSNVTLGKKKDETKIESVAKPMVPKKRGGKAQAAAEAEDKTNKRITSFFKPRS